MQTSDSTVFSNYVLLCNFLEPLLSPQEVNSLLDEKTPIEAVEQLNGLHLSEVDTRDKMAGVIAKGYTTKGCTTDQKSLDVSKFTQVTDAQISEVSRLYTSLISVNLSGCAELTDKSIIQLVRANPHLTEFNASGVVNLTNNAIKTLGTLCPKLKTVKLVGCTRLEENGVRVLLSRCRDLSCLETSIWGKCGAGTALSLAKSSCEKLGTLAQHPELSAAVDRYRKEWKTSPETQLGRFYHLLLGQESIISIENLIECFLELPSLSTSLQTLFSDNLVEFCDAIEPMLKSARPAFLKDAYFTDSILHFSPYVKIKAIIETINDWSLSVKSISLDGSLHANKQIIDGLVDINVTDISLKDCVHFEEDDIITLVSTVPSLKCIRYRKLSEQTKMRLKNYAPVKIVEG